MPFLPIFDAVHRFATKYRDAARPLSDGVRRELRWAVGLLPLLWANLRAEWETRVHATVASEQGRWVVQREVDIDWARALGRENDRWRLNPVQDAPAAVLDGGRQVVSSGGWGRSEHIVVSHRRDCRSAVEELRELDADEPAGGGLAARQAALSTSAWPPPQAGARRVHPEQRQRLGVTRAAPPVGRARLQQRSVPPLTLAKYELVWSRFLEWRRLSGVPEATQRREGRAQGAPFEDLLGAWHALGVAEEYLNGEHTHIGSHLGAEAKFHIHDFGKSGSRRLPQAKQILHGWRRLAPRRTRLPLPRTAEALLAEQVALDGHWATAALVVLSFHCHFGPSEDFKLLLDPVL
ncbi:unnamed protein product, partial [Prorocentrum cordatum]